LGIYQARDSVKPARLQNIPPMQKIILTCVRPGCVRARQPDRNV